MKKIMVTGALGQIGSELVMKLRETYGSDHIIATDIRETADEVVKSGPFEILDVTDGNRMLEIANQYQADTIIHLAALLSATAEAKPLLAWKINMDGLVNALEVARELNIPLPITCQVQQQLMALINQGEGNSDHSAICNFIEMLSNVKISRKS